MQGRSFGMSDLPDIYVFGQNKFGQFRETTKIDGLQKLDWSQFDGESLGTNIINFDFDVTVNYSAISVDFKVIISTVDLMSDFFDIKGPKYLLKSFNFDDLVAKISCNSSFCLVLLENGDIFKINIRTFEKEKLNFLHVEQSNPKKSIFVMNKSEEMEKVIDIACGETFYMATTSFNSVYNIPNKTHQFPKHIKIKKIDAGVEHGMVLTTNGDIYTWGVGLRGQLGHGRIGNETTPKLVDRLAGIKILDIAAGSWHSVAVSVFGDIYVWGWNSHGQLGLKVYNPDIGLRTSFLRKKNQTVYTTPTFIDLEQLGEEQLYVVKAYCGSKHTLVQTTIGKLFVTGSNNYSQLGLAESEEIKFHRGRIKREIFIDEFKELKLNLDISKFVCHASYASLAFVENK